MHAIAACPGVCETVVYGVVVPDFEGRAGMAAIVIDSSFEIEMLQRHLQSCLPIYAQPLFLRIIGEVAITSTFRPKKADLAAQGFSPEAIQDPLYLNDPRGRRGYVRLDAALYADIISKRLKL